MLKSKKLRGVLQLLLSLVLLGFLVRRIGLDKITETLISVDWTWYLVALGLFLLNIAIRAFRWYLLLNSLNKQPTYPRLLYLYFVGFFANNFIPSGFGGDVVKVVSLRQSYGRGTEALSSVLMDRLTGLLGSSLIALAALAWNASSHTADINLPYGLWLAVAVISVGMPLSFVIVRWSDPVTFLSSRLPAATRLPLYDKVERLVDTVNRYPLPALLQSLLVSLPFTLNLIFLQYAIARAFDIQLPPAIFALFVPLIALINVLPFTFNGLGLREGAYLFLFVPVGVPPETAVAMSLSFLFLRFAAGLVGGLLYALSSINQLLRSPHARNNY